MSGYYKGNVFYIGEFDGDMEQNILIPLHLVIKQESERSTGFIDMWVNSYGGNAAVAQHIVELMEIAKRADITVRTMVTSAAYSAGSVVAVAGSPGYRYIGTEAKHLIHYGAIGGEGWQETSPEHTERMKRLNLDFYKGTIKHYKKYCNIPDLEKGLQTDDWHISARDAIKWGMADKLIDKYSLDW